MNPNSSLFLYSASLSPPHQNHKPHHNATIAADPTQAKMNFHTPKLRHIMLLGAVSLIIEGILIVNFYTSGYGSGDGAASGVLWWEVNHRGNKKNPEDDDEFDPSSWMQLKPSSYSMVHKTKNCVMLSNHTRRDALVRVIAYQKDALFQLENLLVHYLQAVRYDEIVIVDNDGVDAKTKALAEKYVNKGVHLWRCAGTMFVRYLASGCTLEL